MQFSFRMSATVLILGLAGGFAYADAAADRQQAYQQITSGQVREGATLLLESLRGWSGTAAEVDETAALVHLLLFSMEYLMDDAARAQFISEVLKPDQDDVDALMLTGLHINLDSGLTQDEFQVVVQKLQVLASSRKPLVKALALAVLGSPYYLRDSKIAKDSRNVLTAEFEQTEISKTVLRSVALGQRKTLLTDPASAKAALEEDRLPAGALADPVIAATREAAISQERDPAGLQAPRALLQQFREAQDPQVRYGCLAIAGVYLDAPSGDLVAAAYRDAVERGNAPDAFLARIELLKLARKQNNVEAIKQGALALLDPQNTPTFYHHNPYEDMMNEVLQAGEHLAVTGNAAAAVECFSSLAAKFPGSALATQCRIRAEALGSK